MGNLLKFEFHKLWRSKSFYICAGIGLILTILTIAVNRVELNLMNTLAGEDVSEYAGFSANSIMLGGISNSRFTTVMGIFVTIFLCDDYTKRTIKNIYSHGFTRSQVFTAKMLTVLIATTIAFLTVLAFSFLGGLIAFGKVGDFYNFFLYLDQYATILVFISFTAFFCFAFRKPVFPILFLLLGPAIVGLVFQIVDLIININAVKETSELAKYWFNSFLSIVSNSTASNNSSILGNLLGGAEAELQVDNLLIVGIGSVAYTTVFTALGWLINRKHNI